MGTQSNNPDKYLRIGTAIPRTKVEEYEKTLEGLGVKTIGEVLRMLMDTPAAVEALIPHVEAWKKRLAELDDTKGERKELLDKLKVLDPEKLRALLELAEQGESNE
jgi:hypothetical protein